MEINKIYNMDCLTGLRGLPNNSIDLTVTSPPYDNLRSYNNTTVWDESFFGLLAIELYRVTKSGGVVVWVVGDATIKGSETGSSFRQALGFMGCGFRLHDTMIYQKRACFRPEINRYYPIFEYMFIFSKGKPKTVNLISDRKNINSGQLIHGTQREKNGEMTYVSAIRKGVKRRIKDYGIRYNIWVYHTGKGNSTRDDVAFKHPAIFPEKLAEDHIITWSNPGDLVLDPFIGSGTTAKMAILNGRHYLGYEIDNEYYKIALQRIELCTNEAE